MAYEFRYELIRAPTRTADGSGCVLHDVRAVYRLEDAWIPVGGRHKDIVVPQEELATVLAMPNSTAKIVAYKDTLATNLATSPIPAPGWDTLSMTRYLDANAAAATTAAEANEFITVDLGQEYPVRFSMEG
jgi:hypothetical protein